MWKSALLMGNCLGELRFVSLAILFFHLHIVTVEEKTADGNRHFAFADWKKRIRPSTNKVEVVGANLLCLCLY